MKRESNDAPRCMRVYDDDVPDPQVCSFPKGHDRKVQPCGTDWEWCDAHNGGDCLIVRRDDEKSPKDDTPTTVKLALDLAAHMRASKMFLGIPAVRAADSVVAFLSTRNLLINDGRIHQIQEVDYLSTNGNESIDWTVYTEPEDNA